MATENRTKINQLLTSQPYGIVFQSAWLAEQGYSTDLQKWYKKSSWLTSISRGAFIRTGDNVSYEGAVFAFQKQSMQTIHPGGRTAFALSGKAHNIEMGTQRVTLFGKKGEKLPAWFKNHDWKAKIEYYPTTFLSPQTGLVAFDLGNFSIQISGAARAMFECLYLTPEKQDLMECFQFMLGLNNLMPGKVQMLLEECTSIKVKRLFLYLAEKANHSWLKSVSLEKVDLGKGKRSIVKNGVYVEKYQITVPKELEENDRPEI